MSKGSNAFIESYINDIVQNPDSSFSDEEAGNENKNSYNTIVNIPL